MQDKYYIKDKSKFIRPTYINKNIVQNSLPVFVQGKLSHILMKMFRYCGKS